MVIALKQAEDAVGRNRIKNDLGNYSQLSRDVLFLFLLKRVNSIYFHEDPVHLSHCQK